MLLSDVLLLVLLHPQVQLVDGWNKDEQREAYGHQGARLGTEDVCDAHLGILVDACQQIGYRIIGPMVDDAWDDAACALVHPAKEQSYEEGMDKLGRIHMGQGKE